MSYLILQFRIFSNFFTAVDNAGVYIYNIYTTPSRTEKTFVFLCFGHPHGTGSGIVFINSICSVSHAVERIFQNVTE